VWPHKNGGPLLNHEVDRYHLCIFVCTSFWPYTIDYIPLHGMNNVKILVRVHIITVNILFSKKFL